MGDLRSKQSNSCPIYYSVPGIGFELAVIVAAEARVHVLTNAKF